MKRSLPLVAAALLLMGGCWPFGGGEKMMEEEKPAVRMPASHERVDPYTSVRQVHNTKPRQLSRTADRGRSFIGITVDGTEGSFVQYAFQFAFDEKDVLDYEAAELTFRIDLQSLDIPGGKLKRQLLGEDFFDTAQYPHVLFASKSIEEIENRRYAVTGKLTVHGVSQEATIDATLTEKSATFALDLDRLAFGIGEIDDGLPGIIPIEAKMVYR